ncbi:hypothetical protein QO209_19490 [Pseudomonas citronellolis]|uniref:hypothetical protein n=1 Tax=Pseudomonas citronellolis TaxID=53408 RepID=UPI00264982D7|nr:hypothetical protein [Pseudomonas citronellolis]MDN6874630.1 hypothetical protein [Pseudomonas citronellolis]
MTSRPKTPPQAPPPPPKRARKATVVEQRIDLEQVSKIDPQDGDILVLPADFTLDTARALAEALQVARPGLKCLLVVGDVRRLNVSEMNALGWYRA